MLGRSALARIRPDARQEERGHGSSQSPGGSCTVRSHTPQASRRATVWTSSNPALQDPQPSTRDAALPVVTWGICCALPGARTS